MTEIEQDGNGLPGFVVAEFERNLRCGILASLDRVGPALKIEFHLRYWCAVAPPRGGCYAVSSCKAWATRRQNSAYRSCARAIVSKVPDGPELHIRLVRKWTNFERHASRYGHETP
jgi:hypothetical protein